RCRPSVICQARVVRASAAQPGRHAAMLAVAAAVRSVPGALRVPGRRHDQGDGDATAVRAGFRWAGYHGDPSVRSVAMPMFLLTLPDPEKARGEDPELSFHSAGADGFARELEHALREDALFQRWRGKQDDPDAVPESLAVTDPAATVEGEQD